MVCLKLKIFFISILLVATWLRPFNSQCFATSTGSEKSLRSRPGRELVDTVLAGKPSTGSAIGH